MSRKSKTSKTELKPPTPDIVKKRLIKGGVRRVFRQSIEMRTVLQNARVEFPPKLLKDGSVGKKNQVRYKCSICGGFFSKKDVAVDHIQPVIPLDKTEEEMTIDEMAYRIWCDIDNLQVVCNMTLKKNNGVPSCHLAKSLEENFIRKKFSEAKKSDIKNIEEQINIYKTEYKKYLVEKELERLEKERRKKEREAKRKTKDKEKK